MQLVERIGDIKFAIKLLMWSILQTIGTDFAREMPHPLFHTIIIY